MAAEKPLSLRDAYLRVRHRAPLHKYEVKLAEEINPYFPRGKYKDLLNFESDIAQIFDLVVLFSESIGSAAELGAFAGIEEIANRLLVVIDDKNYNDNSFVKLGPILALENQYGEASVCVLNRQDIGVPDIQMIGNVNLEKFHSLVSAAIRDRLTVRKNPATFDKSRAGHVIKLAVGLIQHYGAMKLDEVEVALDLLGVHGKTRDDIENYLLCAEFVGWLVRDKRGLSTYYADSAKKAALHYELKAAAPLLDKSRWHADIAEYWKEKDPNRFNAINAARAIAR